MTTRTGTSGPGRASERTSIGRWAIAITHTACQRRLGDYSTGMAGNRWAGSAGEGTGAFAGAKGTRGTTDRPGR